MLICVSVLSVDFTEMSKVLPLLLLLALVFKSMCAKTRSSTNQQLVTSPRLVTTPITGCAFLPTAATLFLSPSKHVGCGRQVQHSISTLTLISPNPNPASVVLTLTGPNPNPNPASVALTLTASLPQISLDPPFKLHETRLKLSTP